MWKLVGMDYGNAERREGWREIFKAYYEDGDRYGEGYVCCHGLGYGDERGDGKGYGEGYGFGDKSRSGDGASHAHLY